MKILSVQIFLPDNFHSNMKPKNNKTLENHIRLLSSVFYIMIDRHGFITKTAF